MSIAANNEREIVRTYFHDFSEPSDRFEEMLDHFDDLEAIAEHVRTCVRTTTYNPVGPDFDPCSTDDLVVALEDYFDDQFDVFSEPPNPPDNPDVARAADRLRSEIARWRDDLVGRQRSDFDESRQQIIDRLAEEYDRVEAIAERYRPNDGEDA